MNPIKLAAWYLREMGASPLPGSLNSGLTGKVPGSVPVVTRFDRSSIGQRRRRVRRSVKDG